MYDVPPSYASLLLQSEIFDKLLEEAEQMHIKRKEATEMLKVLFGNIRYSGQVQIGKKYILSQLFDIPIISNNPGK